MGSLCRRSMSSHRVMLTTLEALRPTKNPDYKLHVCE
jgi:hypothetical protein